MNSHELTPIEQRMQQKWHDLIIAEQQGASLQELEHLYNTYIIAINDHNRYLTRANSTSQVTTPRQTVGTARSAACHIPAKP